MQAPLKNKHLSVSQPKCPVVLPYELEREIFELAAYAFRGHAFKLCTLSCYVQQWMEAIMYEFVVLDYPPSTVKRFMQTFHSRPASFFARTVKHIYLTPMIDFQEAQQIIAAFSGARSVICWSDPLSADEPNLQLPCPQQIERLSIKFNALSHPLTPSLFPSLSHLEIIHLPTSKAAKQIDWDCLIKLPKLTHLKLGPLWSWNQHYLSNFTQILDGSEGLASLILLSTDNAFLEALKKSDLLQDKRVIVQEDFNGSIPLSEYWDRIRHGGPDFWEYGEDKLVSSRNSAT